MQQQALDSSNRLMQEIQSLKEAKDLLESVFNTLQIGISVFRAERDADGNIIDFILQISNHELERQTQRTDLVGIRYAQEYPAIKELGIFDVMVEVLETGKANQFEYFYNQQGFDKWYSCMFVKMGDGIIATNVELDYLKNFQILKQSEEIASLGNWEYDVPNKKMSWTHGMYSLFNIPEGKPINPEIYLEYTTEKSMPIAEKIVNGILTGAEDFDKIIEICVNKTIKTIHVKSTVLKNKLNEPVSVIGVDLDISKQVKLQHDKSKLQNQYKEMLAVHNADILNATLRTQEEERKRISDSLHNGLGQLLYGVKLSLEQLNAKVEDPEKIKLIKKNTDALLTEAIKETRRISHELSPSVLQKFGLKVAINDICQQFGKAMKISFDFHESNIRLSKELELFIYRSIQELTTNIIKHAQATEAKIEVFFSKNRVNINIQDNGSGFKEGKKDGIGLSTIQNHLNLLKGTFKLSSPKSKGSLISMTIPIATEKNPYS